MPDIKTFSAQRIQAAFTLAVAIAFTLFISSTAFAQQQGERAIIAASSFLPPDGDIGYGPDLVFDGDLSTSWTEAVAGPGIGEFFILQLPHTFDFNELVISSGNLVSRYFRDNSRIKTLRVSVAGNEFELSLSDEIGSQSLKLPDIVTTDYLRLTIVDIYPGENGNATTINELEIKRLGVTVDLEDQLASGVAGYARPVHGLREEVFERGNWAPLRIPLEKEQLYGLTKDELRIVRNTMFAARDPEAALATLGDFSKRMSFDFTFQYDDSSYPPETPIIFTMRALWVNKNNSNARRIIELLSENGGSLHRGSPLLHAAIYRHYSSADFFLSMGADPALAGFYSTPGYFDGERNVATYLLPLDGAVKENHTAMASNLETAGFETNPSGFKLSDGAPSSRWFLPDNRALYFDPRGFVSGIWRIDLIDSENAVIIEIDEREYLRFGSWMEKLVYTSSDIRDFKNKGDIKISALTERESTFADFDTDPSGLALLEGALSRWYLPNGRALYFEGFNYLSSGDWRIDIIDNKKAILIDRDDGNYAGFKPSTDKLFLVDIRDEILKESYYIRPLSDSEIAEGIAAAGETMSNYAKFEKDPSGFKLLGGALSRWYLPGGRAFYF